MDVIEDVDIVECYMDPSQSQLNSKEKEYVSRRKQITQTAIKQFIGLPPASGYRLPKINMSFSGGSVRAQIATIAVLDAAEEIGLLPSTTYMAALSGSTWALAPWILHRMSPKDYSKVLKHQLQSDFWGGSGKRDLTSTSTTATLKNVKLTSEEQAKFLRKSEPNDTQKRGLISAKAILEKIKLIIKSQESSELSITQIWGQLIARRLLYDLDISSGRIITFGDIRNILEQTVAYPFPIFTAAIAETEPEYEGLEVTPFSVYSNALGAEINTEDFGSTFLNGICKKRTAEKPLSLYLGIFGSAFAISGADAVEHVLLGICDTLEIEDSYLQVVQPKLEACLAKIKELNQRTFDVEFPNFTYGMSSRGLGSKEAIHLIDHGIFINIPIFPYNRPERKTDILVICDASSDAVDNDYTELKRAQIYARAHGMAFPSLRRFKEINKNLKIFYEDNPEVPIVIYIANLTQISMLELSYTEAEFDSVYEPMYEALYERENRNAIMEAVKFKTSQLNNNHIPNNFMALRDGRVKNTSCNCCLL